MMRVIGQILVNAFMLWVVAQVIPGIRFDGSIVALLILGLIFGIVNAIIKPIVLILTLPLTILTLGLFALVVNALMLMLTSAFSASYAVDGFWSALLGSIVISILSVVLNRAMRS
jgi:putative membrane protein